MEDSLKIHDSKKILALQGLRAVAFLGIFSQHAGLGMWGTKAVSVFLILSGFLMTYTYTGRIENDNLPNCFKFGVKKIMKLYPLHILTMLAAIALEFYGFFRADAFSSSDLFLKTVLNISLLKSWSFNKDIVYSLNGVSWYLCVALFCYILFPRILKRIQRKNSKELYILLLSTIVLRLFVQMIVGVMVDRVIIKDIFSRFSYSWPPFRLFDFIIGSVLGGVFLQLRGKNIPKNKVIFSGCEVLIIAVIIVEYFLSLQNNGILFSIVIDCFTCLSSAALIFIVATEEGVVSKLLRTKILVLIGDVSGPAFLLHQIVLRYIKWIDLSNATNYAIALIGTLGISYIYQKYIFRRKLVFMDRNYKNEQ